MFCHTAYLSYFLKLTINPKDLILQDTDLAKPLALRIIIFHTLPNMTSTAAHSISTNSMVVISLLVTLLTY
jgi:hypothetical protein